MRTCGKFLARRSGGSASEDHRFYVERSGVHRVVFEQERGRIRIGRWAHSGVDLPRLGTTLRRVTQYDRARRPRQ